MHFGGRINAKIPAYTAVLGLKVCPTAFKAQMIDGSYFKTFGIVIASFQVKDKLGKD